MPPKKTKKAPAPPLAGYVVAVSGTFAGTNQTAVQGTIASLGATVAKSVTTDTTILVSTAADVKKGSKKVQDAQSADIPIVSLDWLDECAASQQLVDPDGHLLVSKPAPAPPPAPAPTTNGSAKGTAKGKKRAASPSPAAASPPAAKTAKVTLSAGAPKPEPKVGEGSILASRNLSIPVDDGCPLQGYRVYVDDDGIVYDASLNQTNASHNNNKFYRIQLLCNPASQDFKTWTRWGRVGDHGQSSTLGNGTLHDALMQYQKKFKDKSGLTWPNRGDEPKKGKYAYVERSYEPDTEDEQDEAAGGDADGIDSDTRDVSPVQSILEPPVQSLMQLIFNQQYMNDAMLDLNYDANKMPLGKLSKATINRGFQTLKDLATLLQDPFAQHHDVEDLSNRYYSLIPHDFGRARPPIINDKHRVKKELDLLDSLGDMKEAAELMKKDLKSADKIHQLDRQFRGLGLEEMSVVDPGSTEFTELAAYLDNTRGATHGVTYEVEHIFRIERHGEHDRFQKSRFSKVQSDRRLLWHGSRATNFGGILSQGLRIAPPEAPVSGYMFGKGIYLADMSSKSANYCCAYNSGGHALLLLCDAELGEPMHELTHASSSAGQEAYQKGCWSTWGKGMTGPSRWKDAACVHPSLKGVKMPDTRVRPSNTDVQGAYLQYNEYIAYDIAQVRLRYLFRIRM